MMKKYSSNRHIFQFDASKRRAVLAKTVQISVVNRWWHSGSPSHIFNASDAFKIGAETTLD